MAAEPVIQLKPLGPWSKDAACKRYPEIDFFPKEGNPKVVQTAMEVEAKAICARCPCKDDCLAYAISDKNVVGIWGGTNDKERRSMRRRVARTRRSVGVCPKCKEKTPTVAVANGQLECLDCGTRWPPLR